MSRSESPDSAAAATADLRLSSSRPVLVRHEPNLQAVVLVAVALWLWSVDEYVLAIGLVAIAWLLVRTAREMRGRLGEAWATDQGLRFELPGETQLISYTSIIGLRHRFWSPTPSIFGRVELMFENEIQDAEQVSFAPPLGARANGKPAALRELDRRLQAAHLERIADVETAAVGLPDSSARASRA